MIILIKCWKQSGNTLCLLRLRRTRKWTIRTCGFSQKTLKVQVKTWTLSETFCRPALQSPAVPPAGSQAKVATVPPAGSQAKVAAVPPAGSQARVGPTAAICDMDSAGRQASTVSSSEGSDSDGDFETNQALLAVQNAFRRSSSEAGTAAKEVLMEALDGKLKEIKEIVSSASDDDDAAALEEDDAKSLLPPGDDVELLPPAPFDDTFAWFFLQEAWSKLTVEERRSCRLNVTKSTHAMGEHVSRDAGSWLPIATMCSGSGMAELAHRILTEALGHRELFLHSCEKERFKKKHLLKTVHPAADTARPRGRAARMSFRRVCRSGRGSSLLRKASARVSRARVPFLDCLRLQLQKFEQAQCQQPRRRFASWAWVQWRDLRLPPELLEELPPSGCLARERGGDGQGL